MDLIFDPEEPEYPTPGAFPPAQVSFNGRPTWLAKGAPNSEVRRAELRNYRLELDARNRANARARYLLQRFMNRETPVPIPVGGLDLHPNEVVLAAGPVVAARFTLTEVRRHGNFEIQEDVERAKKWLGNEPSHAFVTDLRLLVVHSGRWMRQWPLTQVSAADGDFDVPQISLQLAPNAPIRFTGPDAVPIAVAALHGAGRLGEALARQYFRRIIVTDGVLEPGPMHPESAQLAFADYWAVQGGGGQP